MAAQPRYMTECEKRLARLWYEEDGTQVAEIARRLRRNKSSIWELLGLEEDHERPGVGRKPALTDKDKDRLVKHTDAQEDCTVNPAPRDIRSNYKTTI